MEIVAIAAVARGNIIAVSGRMPWSCAPDMKHFRETTMGHVVIMGRTTFEDMGSRPLTGRYNIVLTRARDYAPEGVKVCHSVSEAISEAYRSAPGPVAKAFVIGGEEVYRQFAPHVDYVILSIIEGRYLDRELLDMVDRAGRGLKVNRFPLNEYDYGKFRTQMFYEPITPVHEIKVKFMVDNDDNAY